MNTADLDTLDPLQHVVAVLQEDIVLGRLHPARAWSRKISPTGCTRSGTCYGKRL